MNQRVEVSKPLKEHPTPQFRRDLFYCLNGEWDFEINDKTTSPSQYSEKIIVPYAVENKLSKIGRRVNPTDVMHYRKSFNLPTQFIGKRVFIHFEGVDQVCDVFLNGWKVGHHEGGYQSFCFELTNIELENNILQVNVCDETSSPFYARGKQCDKPHGIWYTPTSGIWKHVWLEATPTEYIKRLKIDTSYDDQMVSFKVDLDGKFTFGDITLLKNGKPFKTVTLSRDCTARINLFGDFHPWTLDNPYLYDFKINVNGDVVYSYFAMRKFSVGEVNGFKVFKLNDKPLLLKGVLDQGYYANGGLTPTTEEDMFNDIKFAKDCGFNFIRKHIKIEPLRWYYYADKLGMLVMQDMVNFGTKYGFNQFILPRLVKKLNDTTHSNKVRLGAGLSQTRHSFINDAISTIQSLYNTPCIFAWTIFNEAWGQFDSREVYKKLNKIDSSRLFDVNSGWFDQNCGDFKSRHIYFQKIKLKNDQKRILFLSEFGGYSLKVPGHNRKNSFGYRMYFNQEKYIKALEDLFRNQVYPAVKYYGLAGYVYTQLADVEGEVNGLITEDRQVKKVDPSLLRKMNDITF